LILFLELLTARRLLPKITGRKVSVLLDGGMTGNDGPEDKMIVYQHITN